MSENSQVKLGANSCQGTLAELALGALQGPTATLGPCKFRVLNSHATQGICTNCEENPLGCAWELLRTKGQGPSTQGTWLLGTQFPIPQW